MSIFSCKYEKSCPRYSASETRRDVKCDTLARSTSLMSIPMEMRDASSTSCAMGSSSVMAESSGSFSSLSELRGPTSCATRAYMTLSLTILASSGKCHEYHSRARMANVFKSE